MCFADGDPRRAVESVKGLRGLIGVDFLWSEATRKVTVLEINPRPTTSCVALTRLLPPGKVAGCWINAVCTEQHEAPVDLAGIIHAQRPLRFDADGTILDEGGTGNNS